MSHRDVVGVTNVEGPPVPIPNTEVKLNSAEDTWMEASRENRSTPTSFLLIHIFLLSSVGRASVASYNRDKDGKPTKTSSTFCARFHIPP